MKATLEIKGTSVDVAEHVYAGTYGGYEWSTSLDRLIDDIIGADCECCDASTINGTEYYAFFNGNEQVASLVVTN